MVCLWHCKLQCTKINCPHYKCGIMLVHVKAFDCNYENRCVLPVCFFLPPSWTSVYIPQVHKLVLAACSPYFKAMFTSNFKECHASEVTLRDVPSGHQPPYWLCLYLPYNSGREVCSSRPLDCDALSDGRGGQSVLWFPHQEPGAIKCHRHLEICRGDRLHRSAPSHTRVYQHSLQWGACPVDSVHRSVS